MVQRSGSKPELACERIGGMKYADTVAPVIGRTWRYISRLWPACIDMCMKRMRLHLSRRWSSST